METNEKECKNVDQTRTEKEFETLQKTWEVKTTEKYWDCECKENFIHPKTQAQCYICGALAEEQPDSRVNEVVIFGLPL